MALDKEQKDKLWEQFLALEAKGISMNHYDLAKITSINEPNLWKSFLLDPEVAVYIEQESQILTQAELRKLSADVSDSRSVGQAQLINAMNKLTESKVEKKEGPIFIYTYVPLSKTQEKADNVVKLKQDVFEMIKDAEETDPDEEIF